MSQDVPQSTTPLASTPTAGNLHPVQSRESLRTGRFIVESSRMSKSRSDITSMDEVSVDADGSDRKSFLGSPASEGKARTEQRSPDSRVSTVGRFSVNRVSTDSTREPEILDVIRNSTKVNTTRRSVVIQDTLSSLTNQIQGLIERNNLLESENARLCRELELSRSHQPGQSYARAPSVKSEV
jgi:hypothetical protein